MMKSSARGLLSWREEESERTTLYRPNKLKFGEEKSDLLN